MARRSNSSRLEKQKSRRETAPFQSIPNAVVEGEKFSNLSPSAAKLLFQIAFKYRGYNNGFLTASFDEMSKVGWRSRTTLSKCLKELQVAGFIIKTRQGTYPNKRSLYAITWQELGDDVKNLFDSGFSGGKRRFLGLWHDHSV